MTAVSARSPAAGVTPTLRLSGALFLISFATVLFTLSVWKLLSFFIMPSLFFDLLFIGFPVGAFLGVKLFRISPASFLKTLWILQAVMVLSVFACLTCKHFDYLRAHLFEVELIKLIGQMGTFTALFIPFFCAYGLSEYVGYQIGREALKGRMRLVYALYLFGAAFAYLFLEFVLHRHLFLAALGQVGVSHMLCLAIALVAAATAILSNSSRQRWTSGLETLALGGLLFYPGLEEGFLDLYKGESPQSTKQYVHVLRHRERFQRWGRFSLTEILESPVKGRFAGFYNDIMQWEYAQGTGFEERMLGAIPINGAHAVAPRGRIAIIGSGGGRQVEWARQPGFNFEKILAIELEPAVLEAVRGPLRGDFDSVYEGPNVEAHIGEARRYMEETAETFDLIFLPSVGGYPQMMLEPGNMIRTVDAYRILRDRLTDKGVLAIWYPGGLDPRSILTFQYVRTLGEQGLGMKTQAYFTIGSGMAEYLILAAREPSTALPSPEEIDAFLRGTPGTSPYSLAPVPTAATRLLFVPPDPRFTPITDDQPFLAGNVRHIFSLEQLYTLLATIAGFLFLAGAMLLLGLRRSGDPQIPGRSYWQVAGLSILIGANFLLLEHYVVLALFKKFYVYHQALVIGAISFLVVSGLGSVLITRRTRGFWLLLASVILLSLLGLQTRLPPAAVLLCVAPVAFVTGSLFPALFELAGRNPLAVFAMDALGAAIGSMFAFFVPIAFGLSVFFPVAAAVFFLTAFCTWRFWGAFSMEGPARGSHAGPSTEEL